MYDKTLSDTIARFMLKFEGGTMQEIRDEVQARLGLLPDDVWESEYYRASSRARLWDKEIRRY